MSQQTVTTKPATNEPQPAKSSVGDRSFSVDAYADRLMDDLFEDMDRVLEGGRLPTQVAPPPETISLKPIQVPQIILPQSVLPQPETNAAMTTVETETTETKKEKSGRLLDKLLLGGACASLVILGGLLAWTRGDLQRVSTLFKGETSDRVLPKTPEQLKAEADAKFMAYMRDSLRTMKFQGAKAAMPALPTAAASPNLPIPMPPPPVNVTVNPTINSQPDSGNLSEVLNRIAIALERLTLTGAPPTQTVKVPQTLPPSETTAAAPTAGAAPVTTQAVKPPSNPPAPAPSPSPKPQAEAPKPAPAAPKAPVASVPDPTAAPPLREQPTQTVASPTAAPKAPPAEVATAPTAAPSPAPTPVATAPAPTAAPSPAPTTATAPTAAPTPTSVTAARLDIDIAAIHTLVGIIEVGDRSVALFEIDGASRRFNIGESIASSGWTLVEVKNKEAVIRRNGEVRSIYVGQSF